MDKHFYQPKTPDFFQGKATELASLDPTFLNTLFSQIRSEIEQLGYRGKKPKLDRKGNQIIRIVDNTNAQPHERLYVNISKSKRAVLKSTTSYGEGYDRYIDLANNVMEGIILGIVGEGVPPFHIELVRDLQGKEEIMEIIEAINWALENRFRYAASIYPQLQPILRSLLTDTGAGAAGVELAIRNAIYPEEAFRVFHGQPLNPSLLKGAFKAMTGLDYKPGSDDAHILMLDCAGMSIAFPLLSETSKAITQLNWPEEFRAALSLVIRSEAHVAATMLRLFGAED